MCARPAPLQYSISLTTAHLIAAPIYLVAFYTLYAENSKNLKTYKKYLATHAVCNFVFELYLSVFLKPVLYLPHPLIRFYGVSKLSFLNGCITFILFLFIIFATCWSIVELFEYRFTLIFKTNLCTEWVRRYARGAKITRRVVIVLMISLILSLLLCLNGLFDQTEHKKRLGIHLTFPEVLCMSAIVLPKPIDTGIKPIHLFNVIALITICIGTSYAFSQGIVALLALREMMFQTRTSLRTIAIHKSFIISLFFQISVHGIMLGFPMLIYVIAVLFNIDRNDVGYVAIVVASMHGAMSTLAMIICNRPLSEKACSIIRRVFSSNNVVVRDLSFISMLNSG